MDMKSILKKFLCVLIYKINPYIKCVYNGLFDLGDIDRVVTGEIFDEVSAGVDEVLQAAAGSVASSLDEEGDCEGVGNNVQVALSRDCDSSVKGEGRVLLVLLLAVDGRKQENYKRF